MATRKKSRRRYGKKAGKRVERAMKKRKRGSLRRGPGGKGGRVTSRKQAIAIGLSEARKEGAKVPAKRKSSRGRKRTGGRKTTGGRSKRSTKRSTKRTSKRK